MEGNLMMKRINQKKAKEIKKVIKNWLLLVTVNDIETRTLARELTPLDGYTDTFIAFNKNNTYNIGKFGAYNAIHVQSDMGAMNRDAVMTTVTNAIRMWSPKAIIMIGVAWGMDNQKQKIGDVLVSKKIVQYESAKIINGNSIYRGAEPDAGAILVDRFKSCLDWEHKAIDGFSQKYIGTLLSGEKLLDDKGYRDKLYKQFPEAIGGDMEGAGLATIASANNINEWIVVKGICDWGYGKQTEQKDINQQIAMDAAISLCKTVLCDDSVLEGLLSVERKQKKNENAILRINAYKLFHYRNSQKLSIKELSERSGISINQISRCEKINTKESELSIRIFKETKVSVIRALEKCLNLKRDDLVADDDDLLSEQYKLYYMKRKGLQSRPMKLHNAKIVVFDFDGTLVSPNFSKTTWERIWVELGYQISDCDYYHRKFSNKQISHEQWCRITEGKFKEKGLTKEQLHKIAAEIEVVTGCRETLELLKQRDILLYIVSGSIREIIKDVLGDMISFFEDISANKFYFKGNQFDRIVGTDFDFEGKCEYIKHIIDETKVSPTEVLFVGNSFNDAYVYKSGARTLCINPSNTNYTNSIYWHNYIKELKDLREILPFVFCEN